MNSSWWWVNQTGFLIAHLFFRSLFTIVIISSSRAVLRAGWNSALVLQTATTMKKTRFNIQRLNRSIRPIFSCSKIFWLSVIDWKAAGVLCRFRWFVKMFFKKKKKITTTKKRRWRPLLTPQYSLAQSVSWNGVGVYSPPTDDVSLNEGRYSSSSIRLPLGQFSHLLFTL